MNAKLQFPTWKGEAKNQMTALFSVTLQGFETFDLPILYMNVRKWLR